LLHAYYYGGIQHNELLYLACKVSVELFIAGDIGADESVNISNEFGGNMDPQLFGKYSAFLFFCYSTVFSVLTTTLLQLFCHLVLTHIFVVLLSLRILIHTRAVQ